MTGPDLARTLQVLLTERYPDLFTPEEVAYIVRAVAVYRCMLDALKKIAPALSRGGAAHGQAMADDHSTFEGMVNRTIQKGEEK